MSTATTPRCARCAASMPAGRCRTGCAECHRRPVDAAYRAALGVRPASELPRVAGTDAHGGTRAARRSAARTSRYAAGGV